MSRIAKMLLMLTTIIIPSTVAVTAESNSIIRTTAWYEHASPPPAAADNGSRDTPKAKAHNEWAPIHTTEVVDRSDCTFKATFGIEIPEESWMRY